LNAIEFKEAVEKITKLKISDRESEYLFTMFDSNNDGNIDIAEELNIRRDSLIEKGNFGSPPVCTVVSP